MATKRNTLTEKPRVINFGKLMLPSIIRITIHHHHQDMWVRDDELTTHWDRICHVSEIGLERVL